MSHKDKNVDWLIDSLHAEVHACLQVTPPGMNMIYLPYSDDVRQPEADTSFTGLSHPKADAKQVEAAEHLLTKLNLGAFASSDIANPTLQRHYQVGLATLDQPCSGSLPFVWELLDMCTSPANF